MERECEGFLKLREFWIIKLEVDLLIEFQELDKKIFGLKSFLGLIKSHN